MILSKDAKKVFKKCLTKSNIIPEENVMETWNRSMWERVNSTCLSCSSLAFPNFHEWPLTNSWESSSWNVLTDKSVLNAYIFETYYTS